MLENDILGSLFFNIESIGPVSVSDASILEETPETQSNNYGM